MSEKRVGFTKVSFDVIAKAMAMPIDHRIVDIFLDYQDNKQGIVRVVIQGPKMPLYIDGQKVKEVLITIRKESIEWTKVDAV